MNSLSLIAVAALTSAVVAGGTATLLGGRVAASENDSVAELAAVERLNDSLAELTRTQAGLARELEELRAEQQLHPVGQRSEVGDIDAAVARWMEQRGNLSVGAEGATAELAKAAPVATSLEEALALLDGDLDDTQRQQLWRKWADEGLTDQIVAAWEERAAREPNNPDMQVALGGVYLNKIFEVGNSPEAGTWAIKADKAFDAALALDETHWEARFTKAVSLSFWPPVFGKQGEAIQNFETLVAQQANGPRKSEYAQTHLLLGNMYSQMGNSEKALGAWQAGLAQFPDDEELRKQLEIHAAQ